MRWRRLLYTLAFTGVFLLTGRACAAQVLGGNEIAAGAALNVALRGPYIARGWRRPAPHFVLAQAISVTYELAVDSNGWNRRDVGGRLVGYLIAEGAIALLRKL